MTSDEDSFYLWGVGPLNTDLFSEDELKYLRTVPVETPHVQWLWQAMDKVWVKLGLDNRRPLTGQPIDAFYSHPVWLVNGFFSQMDLVSASQRSAIARHLVRRGFLQVADFGGGFGELAARIVAETPSMEVTIIEPYPSEYGRARFADVQQVCYAADLGCGYDAVIAQDVLEHVEDPVGLAHKLAISVRPGGELIFANCFYPVIRCHLPRTFHLRHTFALLMRAMGLRYTGYVPSFPHIQIFQRGMIEPDLTRARQVETLSRLLGPIINTVRS